MAQQTINVGTAPNDGTGTPLRTAFQYTNSNFSELYTAVGPSGNNIVVPGNATITGDLTVDTSTLKVDSALNKVGVGVATLTGLQTFNVAGDVGITSDLVLKNSGGTVQGYIFGSSGINYRVIAGQPHVWQEGGSDLMRLNSTGLGVGASPSQKLHLYSNTTPAAIRLQSASPYAYPGDFTVGAGGFGTPSFYIYDNTNSAFRFVLDTSGNVGIGVTPKSWLSSYKAIQLGYSTSLSSTTGTDFAGLSSNAYVDSVDSRWERIVSGYATQYYQNAGDGQHIWRIAGTAAADTAITWTNAMTLDASGRLIINSSTFIPPTLNTNGELNFIATSNTNVRFSYRGTDGVTRVANITLA